MSSFIKGGEDTIVVNSENTASKSADGQTEYETQTEGASQSTMTERSREGNTFDIYWTCQTPIVHEKNKQTVIY